MKPTITYLKERHQYWLDKIDETGIWSKDLFKPVDIVIRYNSKSLDGLFHRKYISDNTRLNMSTGVNGSYYDRLIIYQNKQDYTIKEIDSVLVHEMIHQYIIQGNLKDSSSHGFLFKRIMRAINIMFKDNLNIVISSVAERKEGIGTDTYKILVLFVGDYFYACKIKPSKIYHFNAFISKNKSSFKINKILWCESKNLFFDSMRECTTKIHGIKRLNNDFNSFCKIYNIIEKPIIEEL